MASNSKRNTTKTTNTEVTDIGDIALRGIKSIVDSQGVWTGTMTSLQTALKRTKVLSVNQKSLLPRSPSALRIAVNRVVNRLRSRGIGVKFGRTTDHTRTRFVRFTR